MSLSDKIGRAIEAEEVLQANDVREAVKELKSKTCYANARKGCACQTCQIIEKVFGEKLI